MVVSWLWNSTGLNMCHKFLLKQKITLYADQFMLNNKRVESSECRMGETMDNSWLHATGMHDETTVSFI